MQEDKAARISKKTIHHASGTAKNSHQRIPSTNLTKKQTFKHFRDKPAH
jgi:hypothetical protein